ncbi:conserved hypothetical protein [Theileria orientalis strain Shintoku]|uniref:Uncharacterized protein n=1 Tax=Theileria orientalis strain Shintoku TaxID=869250 RepID=J4CDK4_THEOR|nr:conserved hypothetical protein [Theileria orientalis strain Shintoku]BAM41297.1 conserved hypothetical protein [Theileria orientalis strain Shintoku]|eukprot:XP_009691598.1 conserved hypothetical protein [Theileria orientalis strain Shintoku]
MFVTRGLIHHKYAAPHGPKLQALKEAITSKLNPICFYVKNDPNYSTYVQDEHFYGILCSPLFEGKTYSEMNEMVNGVLEPLKTEKTYSPTVEFRSITERMKLMASIFLKIEQIQI